MKFHPLAEALPMLPGHELDDLVNDIRKNGLRVPITLFEKKILDGRNRYVACKAAKEKARFEEYDGDDPVGFILSHNINRRHLPAGKRADYAMKILAAGEIWQSVGRPKLESKTQTESDVAAAAGVSRSTVQRIKKAQKVKTGSLNTNDLRKEIASNEAIFDTLGFPVPVSAIPYWNRSDEVKEVLRQVSKLKSWMEVLQERQDPLYCEVNLNSIRVELGNIYQSLKGALPYAVCTLCQGEETENCDLCKGRGVISEFRWKHALPQEDRDNRTKQIEALTV